MCIVYIGLGLTGAIICFCCSINDVLFPLAFQSVIYILCPTTFTMALTVTPKEYHDDCTFPPIPRHSNIPNVSPIPRSLPKPRALHVSTALSASASGNPNAHIEQRTSPLPVLAVRNACSGVDRTYARPVTKVAVHRKYPSHLGSWTYPMFPGTREPGGKVKSSSCSKIRFVAAATPCSSPISRRGEHAMLE